VVTQPSTNCGLRATETVFIATVMSHSANNIEILEKVLRPAMTTSESWMMRVDPIEVFKILIGLELLETNCLIHWASLRV